ncbi:hypothetical protein WCLP8_3850003 [uncultured Gammaproteobacteria bacterium]
MPLSPKFRAAVTETAESEADVMPLRDIAIWLAYDETPAQFDAASATRFPDAIDYAMAASFPDRPIGAAIEDILEHAKLGRVTLTACVKTPAAEFRKAGADALPIPSRGLRQAIPVETWARITPDRMRWQDNLLDTTPRLIDIQGSRKQVYALWPADAQQTHDEGRDVAGSPLSASAGGGMPLAAKRGRKLAYPWEDFTRKLNDLNEYHGLPGADNPGWESQADIERAMMDWCEETWGKCPAASTIREKIATVMA